LAIKLQEAWNNRHESARRSDKKRAFLIELKRNSANLHPMTRMKAILLFTAAIAFAISPFLVDGFNGFAPDQFPIPQIDPPAQPAGYAFSIWGLILGRGMAC